MIVLSLFDGLSGGMIALERAGIKVDKYYASEIDKYAIEVSKNNYPDIIQLGSVVDLTEKQLLELGGIDLLIGGSPCQGFSMAGKMKGSATKCGREVTSLQDYLDLKRIGFEFDGQSYLFWEYIRIRDIVKPKWFMLENVRITKKWLPMFNEAIGVEHIIINSSFVSAQNRVRFYWTNIECTNHLIDKEIFIKDIIDIYNNEGINIDSNNRLSSCCSKFKDSLKDIVWIDSYNQAIKTDKSTTLTTRTSASCCTHVYINGIIRKPSPLECERLQTLPDGYTKGVSPSQRYKMIGNGWTIDVIAHIFKGLIDGCIDR